MYLVFILSVFISFENFNLFTYLLIYLPISYLILRPRFFILMDLLYDLIICLLQVYLFL